MLCHHPNWRTTLSIWSKLHVHSLCDERKGSLNRNLDTYEHAKVVSKGDCTNLGNNELAEDKTVNFPLWLLTKILQDFKTWWPNLPWPSTPPFPPTPYILWPNRQQCFFFSFLKSCKWFYCSTAVSQILRYIQISWGSFGCAHWFSGSVMKPENDS